MQSSSKTRITRLGTRGSLLARMQSQVVADQLHQLWPDVQIELQIIKTTGDRITDQPLNDLGGKGLFTKEIEIALINGEIDFAVHSYKDVPVTMPLVDETQLMIAAVPRREDARDVLVAGHGIASIEALPHGATVGTGSLRRQCQLMHHRADVRIVSIRGNIDSRLRKQREGEMDGVILAYAGLLRAGLFDGTAMIALPIETMVPAACQGALALQCRSGDQVTSEMLAGLNDPETKFCTDLERAVIRILNADCHSPIGVHATTVDASRVRILISIGQEGTGTVTNHTFLGHADDILTTVQKQLV